MSERTEAKGVSERERQRGQLNKQRGKSGDAWQFRQPDEIMDPVTEGKQRLRVMRL